MRLQLDLEYDGGGFHGWATQPGLRTVEGVLRGGLDAVFPVWDALAVAGRTDTGVHALGQVASLDIRGGPGPDRIVEALNAVLPSDLAVAAAAEAEPGFHARHSARARSYLYRIHRRRARSPFEHRRSWWLPRPFDLDRLAEQAARLVGEHDFRAFTPTETQHQVFVRTVERAAWIERGEYLELEITADSFLRHMVRTVVGTMIDGVDLGPLLAGGERSAAGQTAPSWGLYLLRVDY